MTNNDRLEALLSKAASSAVQSIKIPPVNHAAIARRAERPSERRPVGKWLAVAAAAAAVIALLFLPPVKNAIARAAHTILTMTYFPSSHKNQAPVLGHTITLEQVRTITAFRFVEPRGLPADYHLVAVVKAPTGAMREAVTLRYVSSSNPIGLAMMESAAKASRKPAGCKVLRWVRSPGHAPPPFAGGYHGTVPPPGFKSIPCDAWNAAGTQIQLVDMTGALTRSQIQHVIQLTR
jgi:hypothetical protein